MFDINEIDQFSERLRKGYDRLVANDDILSERYLKNMKVLEESFPSIFEVIKDYEPKNKNVFLEEDGALNLFFSDTKFTLFSNRPFEQIDKRYREFRKHPSRTFIDVSENVSGSSLHERHLSKIVKKRKELSKKYKKYEELPDVVGSIILFGFELGYQLVRILDEHYAKHIYIYEENIDLFYYSLFAIDWEWIVSEMVSRDTTLHLFLGIDEKEFFSQFTTNLRYNGLYMSAHTYMYMGYDKKVVEEFSNQYLRLIMGWGFFDDGVIGISQYLARKNDTYLAQTLSRKDKIRSQKNLDYPVLVLGNGPSLDENIDFVKERAESSIVVCCGTTINTLYKYGIKPDFHVDVERLRHTAEKLESLDSEYLSGITALTVNVMHPDFYDYFDHSIIGMKPGEPISSIMKQSYLISPENRANLCVMHYSGPIVANLALSYVANMGFSEVYLIGVDCGFKDPTQHHSKLSGYYKDDGTSTGLSEYVSGLIMREANHGGYAYTTSIMDTSRAQLELSIHAAKKDYKVFSCFNLSNGVKIKGADPLFSEDVLPFNKILSTKNEVKEYLFKKFALFEDDSYGRREIGDIYTDFREFTQKCLRILEEDYSDKQDFLLMLSRYNELLMKQHFTSKAYNCELMTGSFIYCANEMVDLVLSTPDDAIEDSKIIVNMFKEFVQEMPAMLEDPMASVDPGRGLLDGKYNA